MAKYGVVHSTNFRQPKIFNLRINQEIENGALLTMGDIVDNDVENRQIHAGVVPRSTTLETEPVFIVSNPAWNYKVGTTTENNEDQYINEANMVLRAYRPFKYDVFEITDYSIDPVGAGTPVAVGQFVGLQDGSTRMVASTTEPTDSAFVGKIIPSVTDGFVWPTGSAGNVDGTTKWVMIEVIKNGD